MLLPHLKGEKKFFLIFFNFFVDFSKQLRFLKQCLLLIDDSDRHYSTEIL